MNQICFILFRKKQQRRNINRFHRLNNREIKSSRVSNGIRLYEVDFQNKTKNNTNNI